MPITNTAPVVKPSTTEKTYPHLWINNIQINCPSPTAKGRAVFTVSPYDGTSGEMLEGSQRQIVVKDLFDAIATSPTLQQAMGAIFAAVDEIK